MCYYCAQNMILLNSNNYSYIAHTYFSIRDITIPHTPLECWRPQLSIDESNHGVHPLLELCEPSCDIMNIFFNINPMTAGVGFKIRHPHPIVFRIHHNILHRFHGFFMNWKYKPIPFNCSIILGTTCKSNLNCILVITYTVLAMETNSWFM